MSDYSILVVEDHMMFGKTLVHLLNEPTPYNVVGPLRSGEEALACLSNTDVDLVLIDVSLPHMNGIDLVTNINAQFPQVRCLILSGHMSPNYVKQALDAGARGYVLKDDVVGVVQGVELVMRGKIFLSAALRDVVV